MPQPILTLDEVQRRIEELAKKIDAPANLMPTYGASKNGGTPFLEVDNSSSSYSYRAFDRDTTTMNRSTHDIDELLYWVFQDVTFSMASEYRARHRDPAINYRKVIFSHQLELLEALDSRWRKLRERKIREILKQFPY